MKDRLIISFCVCEVITFIYLMVFDTPAAFLLVLVIHVLAFLVLAGIAFMLRKSIAALNMRHAIALITSIVAMIAELWRINGSELPTFLSELLSNKDALPILGTYLFANVTSIWLKN